MRENRTYGSEGGETGKPVFPTPIDSVAAIALRCGQHRGFTANARRALPSVFLVNVQDDLGRVCINVVTALSADGANHPVGRSAAIKRIMRPCAVSPRDPYVGCWVIF